MPRNWSNLRTAEIITGFYASPLSVPKKCILRLLLADWILLTNCRTLNIFSIFLAVKRSKKSESNRLLASSNPILESRNVSRRSPRHVSVERLFYGLRFIMNSLRSTLHGESIDDILLVRSNWE